VACGVGAWPRLLDSIPSARSGLGALPNGFLLWLDWRSWCERPTKSRPSRLEERGDLSILQLQLDLRRRSGTKGQKAAIGDWERLQRCPVRIPTNHRRDAISPATICHEQFQNLSYAPGQSPHHR